MSCLNASYSRLYRRSPCYDEFGWRVLGGYGEVDPAWGVDRGGGFSTICSPPAHWRRREGDLLSSYLTVSTTQHTSTDHWGVSAQLNQHRHRSTSFWRLNGAWLEWWLNTWAVLNKPNTCFLSGCTCSVCAQGRPVCLPCYCCCVDSLGPIWLTCWMTLTVTSFITTEPRLCSLFSVPLSFWKIPPIASYTAKSVSADPKNGPLRKEFQSQNYLHPHIYQRVQTMPIRAEHKSRNVYS